MCSRYDNMNAVESRLTRALISYCTFNQAAHQPEDVSELNSSIGDIKSCRTPSSDSCASSPEVSPCRALKYSLEHRFDFGRRRSRGTSEATLPAVHGSTLFTLKSRASPRLHAPSSPKSPTTAAGAPECRADTTLPRACTFHRAAETRSPVARRSGLATRPRRICRCRVVHTPLRPTLP